MDIAITDRSFAALDLSAQTLASVEAMGYKAPTDVQSETIPRAITGKDLVITKENEKVVVSFAYDKEVELVKPVFLLIKFEGRSIEGQSN